MATTQIAALYPDITVSMTTDLITGLPTGLTFTPGASHGVAWSYTFLGLTVTGSAAAGGLASAVALVGAVLVGDFSSITVRTA